MENIIELDPRKLVVSGRYQARKTPSQMPLAALADSIVAMGLVQNLGVAKGRKRGSYEVIAGGRRLSAIHMLIKDGRWPEGQKVLCKLIANDMALAVSVTENTHREAMHPADEFEAFSTLVENGESIEDVAAMFGVTPTVVKRRMRLARVAPALMNEYRAGTLSLDTLMAFAVTEDQERQLKVRQALDGWQVNNANAIRQMLTNETVTAADRLARFIGLEAYEDAGGPVSRDLFATEGEEDRIYLQDRALVERLAAEKLQIEADALAAKGWGWVKVFLDDEGVDSRYGRIYPSPVDLTSEQDEEIEQLEARVRTVSEKMDEIAESTEEENEKEWMKLDEQYEALRGQISAIHRQANIWPADMVPMAGCIVGIGYNGQLQVHHGLIHPEQRKQVQQLQADSGDASACRASLPAAATRPVHSERLVRRLTANKVGIVQAALARNSGIALAVLVSQLARKHLGSGYLQYGDYGLGISTRYEDLAGYDPDFEQSRAGEELARLRQHWLDELPKDENEEQSDLLAWALQQDTDTLLELLAYLVAVTVQGVQHQESTVPTDLDKLAGLLDVSMSQWWSPTEDSYLSHVSKDRITQVVIEGAGRDAAAPLAKMKKAEAVKAAQEALSGTNWLPFALQVQAA